jgi:N-acetylmuramoyl-L-alanine amidase
MKKAILFLPTLLIGLAFQHLPTINTTPPLPHEGGKIIKANLNRRGEYRIKTVVIDPGHGGHDPGCLGSSCREKNLALAIGNDFAQALKKNYPGLNVIMTRSTDVFVTLEERAAIATRNKADLFISIHCNYIPKASSIQGTETYVLGLHASKENLEVAKRENESILYEDNYKETYDGYDPNSPEAHIMLSLFQNAFLEQSILFAEMVQKHAVTEASRKDRGVKQAGFLVLRHATMPSVLVETGYLSNSSEQNYINTKKGQKSIANALLLAFNDYKNEMESGSEGPVAFAPVKLDLDFMEPAPLVVELKKADVLVANAHAKPIGTSLPTTPAPIPPPVAVAMDASPPRSISKDVKVEKPEKGTKILASTPIETGPSPSASEKPQTTEVQFCVQLAAAPALLNVTKGRWAKVDYLIEVIEEGNLYKYQVRNFAALTDANAAKNELRASGFNDAFVVAYKNGVKVNPWDFK